MVQSAGCINAGLTGHAFQMVLSYLLVNKETTSPYPQDETIITKIEGDSEQEIGSDMRL